MGAKEDRADLISRLARLEAHREAIRRARKKIADRAGAQLDHAAAAHRIASDVLDRNPDPITARYTHARMIDAARLRAIALRTEGEEEDRGG